MRLSIAYVGEPELPLDWLCHCFALLGWHYEGVIGCISKPFRVRNEMMLAVNLTFRLAIPLEKEVAVPIVKEVEYPKFRNESRTAASSP
jgi:hypothetical protein